MEHQHHGKSSSKFLNPDDVLSELDFRGDETFMDAGCGDGYISIEAIRNFLPNGCVYAVDVYDAAIRELNEYKNENGIENLIPIEGDFTQGISCVGDGSVDVILMLNVFHGFTDGEKRNDVINELSRLINDEGRIAIMDFRPVDCPIGPPAEIKCSPEELEEIFAEHGLKKVHLNENMGFECSDGNSHYMIIFERE